MKEVQYDNLVCLLHEANHKMHEIKSQAIADFGITFPQMIILGFLWRNEGTNVNQKAIERAMNIKGSSVTSILGTMLKSGLVVKTVNPLDAREYFVTLTEKGAEIADKIEKILVDIDGKLIAILSEGEQEEMKKLLLKIINGISLGNN